MIKILNASQVKSAEVFGRYAVSSASLDGTVAEIIARVRCGGDAALREYAAKFDRADLSDLEVSESEFAQAEAAVSQEFRSILERAAANVTEFHSRQVREGFCIERDGCRVGQKIVPMDRVGIYVPGGTAAYPSTVLMDALPAVIAGVGEVIMVTPPTSEGKIRAEILVAARLAGVHRVFKSGGAQAIAALAYGTESIPKVDKIVGPGNMYVAAAKKQVFGQVAIDMIAGPSEILVLADKSARADFVAADMLSQAEHDVNAAAVLVTDCAPLAQEVAAELERQLALLPRREIAEKSIYNSGKILLVADMDEGVRLANELAPEHLELCTENPFVLLESVRHAGSVFLGHYTPEAVGDYWAGTNHTLPTGGTARFSSPLSVDDFVKKTQYVCYTEEKLRACGNDIATFAEGEGLQAHGKSVLKRVTE